MSKCFWDIIKITTVCFHAFFSSFSHTCLYARACEHTHTYIHTYVHPHTHTHTHTHTPHRITHTHIHTHTHTKCPTHNIHAHKSMQVQGYACLHKPHTHTHTDYSLQTWTHPDQVTDQFHFLQQQTYNDEPCIVPQLFHHQVWPVGKQPAHLTISFHYVYKKDTRAQLTISFHYVYRKKPEHSLQSAFTMPTWGDQCTPYNQLSWHLQEETRAQLTISFHYTYRKRPEHSLQSAFIMPTGWDQSTAYSQLSLHPHQLSLCLQDETRAQLTVSFHYTHISFHYAYRMRPEHSLQSAFITPTSAFIMPTGWDQSTAYSQLSLHPHQLSLCLQDETRAQLTVSFHYTHISFHYAYRMRPEHSLQSAFITPTSAFIMPTGWDQSTAYSQLSLHPHQLSLCLQDETRAQLTVSFHYTHISFHYAYRMRPEHSLQSAFITPTSAFIMPTGWDQSTAYSQLSLHPHQLSLCLQDETRAQLTVSFHYTHISFHDTYRKRPEHSLQSAFITPTSAFMTPTGWDQSTAYSQLSLHPHQLSWHLQEETRAQLTVSFHYTHISFHDTYRMRPEHSLQSAFITPTSAFMTPTGWDQSTAYSQLSLHPHQLSWRLQDETRAQLTVSFHYTHISFHDTYRMRPEHSLQSAFITPTSAFMTPTGWDQSTAYSQLSLHPHQLSWRLQDETRAQLTVSFHYTHISFHDAYRMRPEHSLQSAFITPTSAFIMPTGWDQSTAYSQLSLHPHQLSLCLQEETRAQLTVSFHYTHISFHDAYRMRPEHSLQSAFITPTSAFIMPTGWDQSTAYSQLSLHPHQLSLCLQEETRAQLTVSFHYTHISFHYAYRMRPEHSLQSAFITPTSAFIMPTGWDQSTAYSQLSLHPHQLSLCLQDETRAQLTVSFHYTHISLHDTYRKRPEHSLQSAFITPTSAFIMPTGWDQSTAYSQLSLHPHQLSWHLQEETRAQLTVSFHYTHISFHYAYRMRPEHSLQSAFITPTSALMTPTGRDQSTAYSQLSLHPHQLSLYLQEETRAHCIISFHVVHPDFQSTLCIHHV